MICTSFVFAFRIAIFSPLTLSFTPMTRSYQTAGSDLVISCHDVTESDIVMNEARKTLKDYNPNKISNILSAKYCSLIIFVTRKESPQQAAQNIVSKLSAL